MGMRSKHSLDRAPGMRLDLTRHGNADRYGPPSGNACMRGDRLHSNALEAQARLGHRTEPRACGSGTSLVLLIVLAAFLAWLLV